MSDNPYNSENQPSVDETQKSEDAIPQNEQNAGAENRPQNGYQAPQGSYGAQGYYSQEQYNQAPQGQQGQGQYNQGYDQAPQGQQGQGQYNQGYDQALQGQQGQGQYNQGYNQAPQGQQGQGQYNQGYNQVPQGQYSQGYIPQGYNQVPQGQYNQGYIPQGYVQGGQGQNQQQYYYNQYGQYVPVPYRPAGQYWHTPDMRDGGAVRKEKSSIRNIGTWTGLILVLFVVMGLISNEFSTIGELFAGNETLKSLFDMVIWIMCIGVPFLVAYYGMKKTKKPKIPFQGPKKANLLLLAIPSGFLFAMLANYGAAIVSNIVESIFGVQTSMPQRAEPTTMIGVFLALVSTAILPALIEEIGFRGIVMQPLRRYGDWFAIIVSSFMFGLMHGNLAQGVFAFILGIVIGYFVIATDSLWTGIMIHFVNNAFSVVSGILFDRLPSESATKIVLGMQVSLMVLGVFCTVLFILNKNKVALKESQSVLTTRETRQGYFRSPSVIMAIVIMALVALLSMTAVSAPA